MRLSTDAGALLSEVLDALREHGSEHLPEQTAFRIRHEAQRQTIDHLVEGGYLTRSDRWYALTLDGLLACTTDDARRQVDTCNQVLSALKKAYRSAPDRKWNVSDLAQLTTVSATQIGAALTLLIEQSIWAGHTRDSATGLLESITLREGVLDAEYIEWPVREHATDTVRPAVLAIEISGYRPFRDFDARPEELTVVIGANSSGKSSLLDFLRFVSFAAESPLPPEIDPGSAGQVLFHVGGPERIGFALVVDLGQRKPLRYEVEIQGPVGDPKVVRERLATTEPLVEGENDPFVFLDFRAGKGVVRDQRQKKLKRPEWTVQANELALRRALDPTLVTLSRFQGFLTSWRVYSGFDVSRGSAVRRPARTDPSPALAEDGSNLSAVLFSLMAEHQDAWLELETHIRSAIPGFRSLTVKPRGGPGTVIGVWREAGVRDELTLADLSDGTLRLLCWATLCLAPSIPPLVCIDEPELGLHPRVLPTLAGLFRLASARSQLLVSTHSPYLLTQFDLDEIAVMRKDGGRAVFVRPGSSAALRREVSEVGGDALAQLHISDELEARS